MFVMTFSLILLNSMHFYDQLHYQQLDSVPPLLINKEATEFSLIFQLSYGWSCHSLKTKENTWHYKHGRIKGNSMPTFTDGNDAYILCAKSRLFGKPSSSTHLVCWVSTGCQNIHHQVLILCAESRLIDQPCILCAESWLVGQPFIIKHSSCVPSLDWVANHSSSSMHGWPTMHHWACIIPIC